METKRPEWDDLAPLIGLRVLVISHGLERAGDRARGLEAMGYRGATCGEPADAGRAALESGAGAVVVDLGRELGFPDEVVRLVRQVSDVPVVAVGCAGTLAEMTRVLEAGADDYCRPRCPTEEIDLRLRALFRRLGQRRGVAPGSGREIIRVGEIEIDVRAQEVRKSGRSVALSPTEFRLLLGLAEHAGEVVPSKALIARVWGEQYAGEAHYLRLYVRYLRQKLEDDPSRPRYIVNRWGAGYSLAAPDRAA